MTEKGSKIISYINIALVVALLVVFAIILRPFFIRPAAKGITARPAVQPKKVAQPAIYDISKLKKEVPAVPKKEPQSLKEMYEICPKSDVGDDIVSSWAGIDPKDKAIFSELLDKEIADAQNSLISNPEDKRAKNILAISRVLKNMAAEGFNCKIKQAPKKEVK